VHICEYLNIYLLGFYRNIVAYISHFYFLNICTKKILSGEYIHMFNLEAEILFITMLLHVSVM